MKYSLKLTAAIAIEGELCRAGRVVDVEESLAKSLLHRGKARVATAEDLAAAGRDVPAVEDEVDGPTRAELDAALEALPGDYTDPDYVVTNMRRHWGDVFTDADEARVRELVKLPAADATETAPAPAPAPKGKRGK